MRGGGDVLEERESGGTGAATTLENVTGYGVRGGIRATCGKNTSEEIEATTDGGVWFPGLGMGG